MTTQEQVNQRLKEYEAELKTWEDRLIQALAPVIGEVELCNRMIRHCKKSMRIYGKSFPNLIDNSRTATVEVLGISSYGNQESTATVASNSTAGQVH